MNDPPVSSDSKFRRYSQGMEKALQTFETITEWPDIVSFLGRIEKLVQSYPQYNVIPCKLALGKRLAQCLNPALPSGVHSKTLEIYAVIFETTGSDRLAEDFFIYSFGLLPFFEHCPTTVKPQYFSVLDKHVLPISGSLASSRTSLFSSLVIGLEDEGSEFFKPTVALLDRLWDSFNEDLFNQGLVSCFVSSTKHRLSIMNYVGRSRHRDSLFASKVSNRWALLVSFVQAGVKDDNILVLRTFLDIVVDRFPLLKSELPADVQLEITRTIMYVLTKKDGSLTRRLYSWLLPGNEGSVSESVSLILANSLTSTISLCNDDDDFSSLFKIMVCLLDNGELSNMVLPRVIIHLISLTMSFECSSEFDKVRVANQFFEIVDLNITWTTLSSLLQDSIDEHRLRIFKFALENLAICDPDALGLHMNGVLYALGTFLSTEPPNLVKELCVALKACARAAAKAHRFEVDRPLLECLDEFLAKNVSKSLYSEATKSIVEALIHLSPSIITETSAAFASYLLAVQSNSEALSFDDLGHIFLLDMSFDLKSALQADFFARCIPHAWKDFDHHHFSTQNDVLLWLYSNDPVYFDHSVSIAIQRGDNVGLQLSKFEALWNCDEMSEYKRAFGTTLLAILNDAASETSNRATYCTNWLRRNEKSYCRILESLLFMICSALLCCVNGKVSSIQLLFSYDRLAYFFTLCKGEFLHSITLSLDLLSLLTDTLLSYCEASGSGEQFPILFVRLCRCVSPVADQRIQVALLRCIQSLTESVIDTPYANNLTEAVIVWIASLPAVISSDTGLHYQILLTLVEKNKALLDGGALYQSLIALLPGTVYITDNSSDEWRALNSRIMQSLPIFRTVVIKECALLLDSWLGESTGGEDHFRIINGNILWLFSSLSEAAKTERDVSALYSELEPLFVSLLTSFRSQQYCQLQDEFLRLVCEKWTVPFAKALVLNADDTEINWSRLVLSVPEESYRKILDALYRMFKTSKGDNHSLEKIAFLYSRLASLDTSNSATNTFVLALFKEFNANTAKYRAALPGLLQCALMLSEDATGEAKDNFRRLLDSCSVFLQKSSEYLSAIDYSPQVFEVQGAQTEVSKERAPVQVISVLIGSLRSTRPVPKMIHSCILESFLSVLVLPSLSQRQEGVMFQFARAFLLSEKEYYESSPRDVRSILIAAIDSESSLGSAEVRRLLFPYLKVAVKKEGSVCWREMLEKLTANLSGNLFTSKETELNTRVAILRRMCFLCLSSSQSLLLTFWPTIIEKVVETFKNSSSGPIFHAYMFLRSSILTLNIQTISSFMPILCAHIYQTMEDSSESPAADWWVEVTGICHFLDLLLLLYPTAMSSVTWGFVSTDSDTGLFAEMCMRFGVEMGASSTVAVGHNLILTGKRLAGYPDLAEFIGSLRSRLKQVSVPVTFGCEELAQLAEKSLIDI